MHVGIAGPGEAERLVFAPDKGGQVAGVFKIVVLGDVGVPIPRRIIRFWMPEANS